MTWAVSVPGAITARVLDLELVSLSIKRRSAI